MEEAPTGAMKFMEEGWPPEDSSPKEYVDETECYSDWDCIARLFAVHGPSLETVTFARSGLPVVHYSIFRGPHGRVEARESEQSFGRTMQMTGTLDPGNVMGSWPRVYTDADAAESYPESEAYS